MSTGLLMPSYQPIPSGLVALASQQQRGVEVAPMILGPDGKPLTSDAFHSSIDYGPGVPLVPRISDPAFPPREFQYLPGQNLVTTPRQEAGQLSFAQLKALVAACPYARIAIQFRKTQIRALDWDVVPEDAETESARIARKDDIARATDFIQMPNRIDRVLLSQWLGQAAEEILVTDALTFYRHRTIGGEMHSLVQIDGSTIKPLIDEWGHIVAYQQILYGYPATQYPIFDRGDVDVLVYNPKVDSTYGTPPAEELAPIINVAIRRLAAQAAWYMDGNVPVAFIEAPEGWSDTTIAGFQSYLDDTFSGNTIQRSRMRLLPNGANYTPAKPFEFTKDEEEAVLAQVLSHYGVPKHLLVAQTNRATAQAQSDEAEDTGLKPLIRFLSQYLTSIIRDELGLEGLVVKPVSGRSGKELEQAQAHVALVTAGVLTVDEARAERGLDPVPVDEPTGTAEVQAAALNGAQVASLQAIVAAVTARQLPAESAIGMLGVAFPTVPPDVARAIVLPAAAAPAPEPPAPPVAPPPQEAPVEAVSSPVEATDETAKAEVAAWRRFALHRLQKGRQADAFTTSALAPEVAASIRSGLASSACRQEILAVFAAAEAGIEKARPRPKPRPLDPAKARAAEARISGALGKWFRDEERRVLALAASALKGRDA